MPEALSHFSALPLKERLFVRARLLSAPLEEMAKRAPAGKVADVGCGHGVLTALLAHGRSDRHVIGVDPDERKIAWARQALSHLDNVSLEVARIEDLAGRLAASLDCIVVADVLYLLPIEAWAGFVRAARALLRPGGRLLLKEAEADGSWKYWKCLLQEEAMVRLFRRTQSSGGLQFMSRGYTAALLEGAGFRVDETVDLSSGYATPHVLFVAEAR